MVPGPRKPSETWEAVERFTDAMRRPQEAFQSVGRVLENSGVEAVCSVLDDVHQRVRQQADAELVVAALGRMCVALAEAEATAVTMLTDSSLSKTEWQ